MRKFILGTDWWTDCDDAVAIRLIARAHQLGEIELLGVAINACMEYSAASLKAFLSSEGVDVPLGIDLAATDFGGCPPYQKRLAEKCRLMPENSQLENAVDLYIRLLSEISEKAELIEIGYPQVLAELAEREPELIKNKVARVWMMAGKWDSPTGKENNFARNDRSRKAARRFCNTCPVPIVFLGWEIGAGVLTGANLSKNDPLYWVLDDFGAKQGRDSWDPMLAELAIIGDFEKAGYTPIYGTAFVDETTGENTFVKQKNGLHCYVKKTLPDIEYQNRINRKIASR